MKFFRRRQPLPTPVRLPPVPLVRMQTYLWRVSDQKRFDYKPEGEQGGQLFVSKDGEELHLRIHHRVDEKFPDGYILSNSEVYPVEDWSTPPSGVIPDQSFKLYLLDEAVRAPLKDKS
jgi:hypothetical protein